MSYTKTKVTYIGTNEEELELENKGVKPDYYEYDQAIANGDIKTNYDDYKQRGTKMALDKLLLIVRTWEKTVMVSQVGTLTSGLVMETATA